VLAEPAFVGREQELTQLDHHLTMALEGEGTTVFVSGEAGTGKTRLTNEFLKRAKNKGATILSGWCLSETTMPYFPFVEAFDSYFSHLGADEQTISSPQSKVHLGLGEVPQFEERGITSWLTGIRTAQKPGKPETFSSQVWKDQTFAAVARTIHSISAREPIILYIEDIHWADSASLALLHYLARAIDNSERVFIIATFRSEELTADAEGHPHPLVETLRMMRREDLFTEIKLANLNEASVSKMAQKMVGGRLQEDFAQKLVKESQGNALFVVESLRMLSERKGLVQENNEWRLAVDEFGIPSKVKDIILRRLAVLKYGQRRVLDAASVIGVKFDLELLSNLLGLDSLEVLETLNVIANSTSLVCAEGNFYRFDHERSREALYEELSLPLKRGYHARIAKILEGAKSTALSFGDLAYHYAKAENKEKAVKYALEAGKDALAKYSSSQAISHFTYVLQALGEDPEYAEQKDVALEGLGDAFYASNKFKEAIKTFETLANTDNGAVKMRALTKAMFAAFFQGDFPHIGELVRRAEEYGDLSRLDRAHILHFKMFDFSLDRDKGSSLLEESLRIFEEEYALSDAAWLLFLAAGKRKMEKRLAMCLRSIAIYEDLGDFRSQMEAYNQTGGGHFSYYALYPEALGLLKKIFEIEHNTKMGNYVMLTSSCNYSAQIVGLMGDFSEAVEKGLRALKYLDKAGSTLYLFPIYSNLVVNYVRLGDMFHADEYFDKMVNMPTVSNDPFTPFYTGLAKAVYYAGKNQWDKSTKNFNETAANPMVHSTYSICKFVFQENYAWALEKQGKSAEANKIRGDIKKVVEGYAERVKHAHVELGLIAPINVVADQTFEARLDIVNVSRANCTITDIQNLLPSELEVITIPTNCTTHQDVLKLKDNTIGPFSVKTVTIGLQASKAGTFNLNPQVAYVDDLGQTKTSTTRTITITAKPEEPKFKMLPGRLATGYMDLDRLLLGGIPENYAVVLTGSPCDEREMIVKNFLEAGVKKDQITFYVSTEADSLETLLDNPNFYLFLCNPKPKNKVPDLPNVYRLRGKTDLTNLSISLAKAYRNIEPSKKKRICVEIVSDVLLDYGPRETRKWISELITDLALKGFTLLAIMDPSMHPTEQSNAVINLFDGEIELTQTGDPLECKKSIRIKKLRNKDFIRNSICFITPS
jgi:KaiC/GvpD/RAD55 family RecA-like ATPase/tetratricopeptide (TPR) repeat protein